MTQSKYNSLLLISLAILLTRCQNPKVIEDADLLSHLNSYSVDTLYFKTNKYFLEACLYRDFITNVSLPKTRPLLASVWLINYDRVKISNELTITKLYVVDEPLIWISSLTNPNDPNTPESRLLMLSNNGPEWETGILVDVVVEVRNKTTKDKFLVIQRDVTIEKVEIQTLPNRSVYVIASPHRENFMAKEES